jgi:tetratricopeptide (TPR) repeat protein
VVGTDCIIHPLRSTGEPAMPYTQEHRPQPVPATVGWVSVEHDFALIEIKGGPLLSSTAGPLPFGEVPVDGVVRQIIGSGFPEAAGADQRTIIGTLTWVLTGRRRFDIDVITVPRDWSKWGGFSGAAIFADNILVGVVRTVDENWNGGVLEATPAVWLLEDIGLKKYLEVAGFSLPVRLEIGAVDRIMPLDFETDAPIDGMLRFSPRNPRIPFLGREAALRALDEFLTTEGKHPFTWWLVTGGGGTGKTRLARELCLLVRRRGWRAGFLPSSFVADIAGLDAWCPPTPTLIVADYVMKRIEEIRKLAVRLARRDGLPPLRLLLLEREAGELFENQFLGSDQSDRGEIVKARYQRDSLSLSKSKLTEDEVWSLVEACPWRSDAARVPLPRNEFFQRLEELDSQRRPLVAMILADARATSATDAGLDSLEKILQKLLQRDRDHLWPKELGVAKTAIGKTEADIAIAFATMVDGLGPPELEVIAAARRKPIDETILPACGIAIGKPLGSVPRLGRLEPDLIGEFFALEALRGDPTNPFAKPPHSWLPKAAWRARGSAMFDFVTRAKQTFPEHVSIPQVDITVEGVRESWLLAALAILSGANDPTAGFDEVHNWLRPHTLLDAGAALAFADLCSSVTFSEGDIIDPPRLIALFDALGELYQAHPNEPTLREPVAMALLNVGFRLGALGRSEAAIAVYDDVVARFGAAGELPLRASVAMALCNKGGRLGALGRREAAIAAYDDLVARFGAAGEPPLLEPVAKALYNKGVTLAALGLSEAAIPVYEDVVERFGAVCELSLRELVAAALVNKAGALGALGRSEAAIAVCDDVVVRFDAAGELPLRASVAMALYNKGVRLDALGHSEAAIAVYDEVVARVGAAGELPLREQAASALVNKGLTLDALGRSEAAISAYDEVVARFGAAGELPLREAVANALVNKGFTLDALGRSEATIGVYDEMVERFGAASELPLRELVAKALVNKGVTLGDLGRGEAKIAVCDDVIERFGAAGELPLREQVAMALFNKALMLVAFGRGDSEIAVYDEMVDRFGAAGELPLREAVAKALVNKGFTLGALGRSEAAIAVYDEVVERFGTAGELPLREAVAKALVNKGAALGALGRSKAAIAVCDEVVKRFGTAGELPLRELVATAFIYKGFTLGALGRSKAAIAVCDEVVKCFGTASDLPLREAVDQAMSYRVSLQKS